MFLNKNTNLRFTTALFALFFVVFSLLKVDAQVEDSLRRHFIVSIDKYPGHFKEYIFSPSVIDAVANVLDQSLGITQNDYVSIVYYGIATGSYDKNDFITIPYYQGEPLTWIPGNEYRNKWNSYNYSHNNFNSSGESFSLQTSAKKYSYYKVTNGNEKRVNATYVLRVTDNQENTDDGKESSEFRAFQQRQYKLNRWSIPTEQWNSVMDSINSSFLIEDININNQTCYPLHHQNNLAYGVYVCQVIPKETPSFSSVIDISKLNVRQVKKGQRITFNYQETEKYSAERISVSYCLNDKWIPLFDKIRPESGTFDFVIPDDFSKNTLKLKFKVWGANKNNCCEMVISPYDETSGNQLEDYKELTLSHAKVFGIPLTKNWPWFSDNANLTALIWMLLVIALIVSALFLLFLQSRKIAISKDNLSLDIQDTPVITVNLINKAGKDTSELASKVRIKVQKPKWSKGRVIKQNVSAAILIDKTRENHIKFKSAPVYLSESEFSIRDYNKDLQVFVTPNLITDCDESQTYQNEAKIYILPTVLVLKTDDGTELLKKLIDIQVRFSKITNSPKICIKNKNGEETDILEAQYLTEGIEQLGTISLVDPLAHVKRAPHFKNDTINATLLCDMCPDALTLQSGEVSLDKSNVINPTDSYQDYEHKVEYTYSEKGYTGKRTISKNFVFRLKQNDTLPKLCVWIKDRKKSYREELMNGNSKSLSDIHFIPDDAFSQFWNEVTIENHAEQGRSGVALKISNFRVLVDVTQEGAEQYEKDKTAFVQYKAPIDEVVMYNVCQNRQEINLKIGWNSIKRQIRYQNQGKVRYDITVRLTICFVHETDTVGNGIFSNPEEFKVNFVYKIYQDVHREWLGVDFGTSAIVSQYGDEIVNLRDRKRQLYKNNDFNKDTYENNTKFLSSNVVFRETEGKDKDKVERFYPGKDYENSAICLSPTSSLELRHNKGILPCLKLMVGYDQLPMLSALDNQRYTYNEQEITFGKDSDNPLKKVENIFREVYSQLLRYFVMPEVGSAPVDNVVLTIPNTYTSMHLDILKECIARSSIGDMVRNIQFVSESDAVACYYQSNWAQLNPNRRPLADENILVYDMGAGTLDVSLLKRKIEGEDTSLQVIGKIGVGRAGNYLDAILAETIAEMNPEVDRLTRYLPSANITPVNFKHAASFKLLIKDVVKPNLNGEKGKLRLSNEQCEDLGVEDGFTIDLDALRSSDNYQQYIESCTSDFFGNFFAFHGFNKNKHRPRIDTLILSGRASNQNILIEALRDCLADWCGGAKELTVIPLWQGSADVSKISVIEGAISYVSRYMRADSGVKFTSNNITADYGIVYQDGLGTHKYMCLLSHSDRPEKVVNINGAQHFVYHREHSDIDLRTVNQIKLIQSYTTNPVNSDGTVSEYTTIIGLYHIPDHVDRKKLTISIDIDETGQISIAIDGAAAVPQAATQVDLNSNTYKMGLWPMMNN